jgi:hypothetical protein
LRFIYTSDPVLDRGEEALRQCHRFMNGVPGQQQAPANNNHGAMDD